MPAGYAHYTFGNKVIQRYSWKLRDRIERNRDLFQIGLQGPDIFFYYMNPAGGAVRRVAGDIHRTPARVFFGNAAACVREMPEGSDEYNARLAYALGFLCHFSLDVECHGYIEKKIAVSGIAHDVIEGEFDRYLITKDGEDPASFRYMKGKLDCTREEAAVIAEFFPDLSARNCLDAVRDMARVHRLLRAPKKSKRVTIYAAMKIARKYDRLRGHVLESEPEQGMADSDLRLEKLMNHAVGTACRLTENFLGAVQDGCSLDLLFDRDFGPGPDWQKIPVLSYEEEIDHPVDS